MTNAIPNLAVLDSDPERLMTDEEVAPYRGGGKATLDRDAWAGTGIPYFKLGRKRAYRAGDVATWVRSRRVATSDAA